MGGDSFDLASLNNPDCGGVCMPSRWTGGGVVVGGPSLLIVPEEGLAGFSSFLGFWAWGGSKVIASRRTIVLVWRKVEKEEPPEKVQALMEDDEEPLP